MATPEVIESKKLLALNKNKDVQARVQTRAEQLQQEIESLHEQEEANDAQLDQLIEKIIENSDKTAGMQLIEDLEKLQRKESELQEQLNTKKVELRELRQNLRQQILEIQKQLWDNLDEDGMGKLRLKEARKDLVEVSISKKESTLRRARDTLRMNSNPQMDTLVGSGERNNDALTEGSIETITKWEIDPKELQIFTTKLGRGNYGEVYQGKYQQTDVAVKRLHVQQFDEEGLTNFVKEVQIMTSLKHQNILLFMGACTKPDKMCVVTEHMANGSVEKFIHTAEKKGENKEGEGNDEGKLSFRRKLLIAKGVAQGMNWLHNLKNPSPILHLDLKPANLLLDDNFNVRISDFGMSVLKSESRGYRGSPSYMSPEMLNNQPYDSKTDIYSFGITLWEICSGKIPYEGKFNSLDELKSAVIRGVRPEGLSDKEPELLKKLINNCWNPSPHLRPSFKEMLVDRVFDKIILEKLIKKVNETGARFWVSAFDYKWEIPWKDFIVGFEKKWKADVSNQDIVDCFKFLLLANTGKQVVTIEAFANVLEWFGPVSDGQELLEKIWKLCSKPWFWGHLDTKQAERQLAQKSEGSFLVRFSNTSPGSFTISSMTKEKKVKHMKIKHSPGTNYEVEKKGFDTLDDLVAKAHTVNPKSLYYKPKLVCEGSPLYAIYFREGKKKMEEGMYAVTD